MQKFSYVIQDPLGLHARPAGMLVKEAAKFNSEIMLERDGLSINAKSILQVMRMSIKTGETVSIRCCGEDEEQACFSLRTLLKSSL
jgi:phosphocarrier protein